jgi:preprotein translocase subunit SecY
MASNAFSDIFRVKDLRDRIVFTLFILIIYRLGAFITLPGVNVAALQALFDQGGGNGIADFLDFFAGGAFKNFSIFMLSITPYVSAQIIVSLLVIIFPKLKRISEEEGGRKKINRWTRIGTILVCVVQGYAYVQYALNADVVVLQNTFLFIVIGVISVTAGTMFVIWLGEQITQRGVGNGVSLIIFAGIVARLPESVAELFRLVQSRDLNAVVVIVVLAMFVGVVALVVLEQQGQRKIPVHYAKRVVGRRMYGAQNTYIPFKINPSGVIPVIFASSLLTFPLQFLKGFESKHKWARDLASLLATDKPLFIILYVLFIVGFAYFYTQISLNPQEISKQIRENGGSIPGIRSEKMEEYLTRILNRIVLPGALYLALIALIPTLVQKIFSFPAGLSQLLGGTSLIIIVGVDLDTMAQIEANLRMHHHDGLVRKGKLRSRNL